MDVVLGNTQTEELVVNESACMAINEESANEGRICGIKKEAFDKVCMGTFCKVADIKEEDGKKVYNLEDAYGNMKGFDEAQVLGQLQLGTLNVINLEIDNNNKLVKKTPEAMEVTYDNINYIREFPCLVKIFDQTTEKEGTAVAVGYKHEDDDKYKTVINVVINGNMYEATYQNIKSQDPTCHENTCLTCNKRSSGGCRYNRYGGGWKLCINIGGQYERVAYEVDRMHPDRELLAVVKDNGVVKAYLETSYRNGTKKWHEVNEREPFEDMKFANTLKWGGVFYYDVPVIDWTVFGEKREERLIDLQSLLLRLGWEAAKQGYFEIDKSCGDIHTKFEDQTAQQYFDSVFEQYCELGGEIEVVFENIGGYCRDMCLEENMHLWEIESEDYLCRYAADVKWEDKRHEELARYYIELVSDFVTESQWSLEMVEEYFKTNLWDRVDD